MSPETVTRGTGKGPEVKWPPGGQTLALWASDSEEGRLLVSEPCTPVCGRCGFM